MSGLDTVGVGSANMPLPTEAHNINFSQQLVNKRARLKEELEKIEAAIKLCEEHPEFRSVLDVLSSVNLY